MSNEETTEPAPQQCWRIGDVSRASGVSVRMLRHYDQIGLLRPSGHSDGGHREYSADDAMRLEAIVALRTLGFSLTDVAELLDGAADPATLLAQQLAAVDETIALFQLARARLVLLETRLSTDGAPAEHSEFLELAGLLTRCAKPLDREALERLIASRRTAMGQLNEPGRARLSARRAAAAERLGPEGVEALRAQRTRALPRDDDAH